MEWLTSLDSAKLSALATTVGIRLLVIILILIGMKITQKLVFHSIEKIIGNNTLFKKTNDNENRRKLVVNLLKNGTKYLIYFMGGVMILDTIGINAISIVTTAGIGGIAVAFGAQSLIKDLMTGIFILLENQYSVGDYINISGITGHVVDFGIRVTTLKDFDGTIHTIPNGTISVVSNHSREDSRIMIDVGIAYEEDVERAILALKDAMKEINATYETLITAPVESLGVVGFGSSDVTLRVLGFCKPMEHYVIEREVRKKIKEKFDEQKIEIPYQKQVLYIDQESRKEDSES